MQHGPSVGDRHLSYVFLVGPIAIIVAASFAWRPEITFPPEHLSFELYRAFFSDP